mmetsp:Transcript_13654/g.33071  ORF Transcript_13654/g.33071 Transcript_13654/m.33071 type:complete len:249 (+) Transcript_13654:1110-1856(+)
MPTLPHFELDLALGNQLPAIASSDTDAQGHGRKLIRLLVPFALLHRLLHQTLVFQERNISDLPQGLQFDLVDYSSTTRNATLKTPGFSKSIVWLNCNPSAFALLHRLKHLADSPVRQKARERRPNLNHQITSPVNFSPIFQIPNAIHDNLLPVSRLQIPAALLHYSLDDAIVSKKIVLGQKRQQFHLERQCSIPGNFGRGPLVPVPKLWRQGELRHFTDSHCCYPFVPALDHLSFAQCERKWLTAVAR